ncbi:MAG: cytochrome c biogenesis protein CcsA [FCB group bacterium]|nr:cytochrome c biogenesis protein CcsA [FCB group bacterium]
MNIGILLIVLASVSMLVCTAGFFMAARGYGRFFDLARKSYSYFTGAIIAASILLFYYFLSGDYSYKYVYDYSSSDLPLGYLISGFWAGQQGTYLLWSLLLAVMGYFILHRGKQYTSLAMFFYGVINLFYCVMLLALSPFEKLAIAQPEGAGLNPLLQDPWMVIHPPIIFIGYAAAAVPCAIALAAMVRNDYRDWLRLAIAPVALTALALAAGNILGGFWAYKTLGWGGYWAWDPVENSSFIPWMIVLASLHGLIIERKCEALRKTNLFLVLFTFLLVVYGTFLTRSGVLADFSVHSFVDLGVNNILIGFMVGFSALALGIFAFRAARIKSPALLLRFSSREFGLLLSVWLLLLIGLVVLAGTSWPLISTAMGKPGTVDTVIYTRLSFPLTIVIGLFLGFIPFMLWGGGSNRKMFRQAVPAFVAALIIAVIAWFVGVKNISYLLYIFTAAFAFSAQVPQLVRYFPDRWHKTGPTLAHLGFTLMLIGILGSSAYSTGQKVIIDRYSSDDAYGLDIKYLGIASELTTPNNEIILSVTDGDDEFEARPRLFWTDRMGGFMKKPHIERYLLYDLYLAPEQIEDRGNDEGIKLIRGDSVALGEYMIGFVDYDQAGHEAGAVSNFGAILNVTDSSGRTETITPALTMRGSDGFGHIDVPLMTGLEDNVVRLEKILADEAAISISIAGLTSGLPKDRLIMEVSQKPTMNLLWGGTFLILLGGLLSLANHWKLVGLKR